VSLIFWQIFQMCGSEKGKKAIFDQIAKRAELISDQICVPEVSILSPADPHGDSADFREPALVGSSWKTPRFRSRLIRPSNSSAKLAQESRILAKSISVMMACRWVWQLCEAG
jgi:hypothetical protein